jgi:hypothetical protein
MNFMVSAFSVLADTAKICKVEIQQSHEKGLEELQRSNDIRVRCQNAWESGSIGEMVAQKTLF